MYKKLILLSLSIFCIALSSSLTAQSLEDGTPLYPNDLVVDGDVSYVTSKGLKSLLVYKGDQCIEQVSFEQPPTGVAVSGDLVYVTTSYNTGHLHKLSKNDYKILSSVATGMGAKAPLATADGKYIYVCNQFDDNISKVEAASMRVVATTKLRREPFAAVLSKDEKKLFAVNFLPAQAAHLDYVANDLSILDSESMKVISTVKLSNGSNALRDIAATTDGKYILISHNLGRFQVPTSQLQQGWMNTNAMSVVDAHSGEFIGSVLLDKPERGFAGIWGIATTDEKIFITHSGVHENNSYRLPKTSRETK